MWYKRQRRGRSAPAAPVEAPAAAGWFPWLLAFAAGTLAGLVVVVAAGRLFKRAKQERAESSREAPPQRKLRGGGSSEEPPAHRTSAFGMQGKRAAMEDAHVVASQGPVTVAGVFDGCGCARAAKLCGARLASEKLRRALLDARAGDAAPALSLIHI